MPSPNVARPQAVLGLLTVLGVLTACGGPDESPKGAGPIPVTVVTLTPQSVTLTRELPGRTTAFLVAEVRPQVERHRRRSACSPRAAWSRPAQPLYQLDDATYRADYAEREGATWRAPRPRWSTAQLECRAQRESGQDRRRQQAGRRKRRRSAATRPKPTFKAAKAAADRTGVSPRLCAHHRADQRPHRQVHGDRRARW